MKAIQFPLVRWVFVLALFFFITSAQAQTNSWISSGSGDWESPEWSLGLPAPGEDIFITNSGGTIIYIEPTTVGNYPQTLTVNSVTLSAPAGSSNTLFLNEAGTATPLTAQTFSVRSNCAVQILGSALEVFNELSLDGVLVQSDSVVICGSLNTGSNSPSIYELSSGLLTANSETVGVSQPSLFEQDGGTNMIDVSMGDLSVYPGSEYDLKSGSLDAGALIYVGSLFKMEGGSYIAGDVGVDGTLMQTGGTIMGDTLNLPIGDNGPHQRSADGVALQTGGTNMISNLNVGALSLPPDGAGTFTLSNGWLSTVNTTISSDGTFKQDGGQHTVSSVLTIGQPYPTNPVYPALYQLGRGALSASNITIIDGGALFQNGGTNIVTGTCSLSSGAAYSFFGGWLSVSNLAASGDAGFVQSDGTLIAQNVTGDISQYGGSNNIGYLAGSYYEYAGILVVSNYQLTNGLIFQHSGGVCIASLVTLDNGTWQELTNGASLGQLQLGSGTNSIIQFPSNNCYLQFGDSSALTWSNGGVLTIIGWNGDTNGFGGSVLSVGTNSSGLTALQLARIQFANPMGLPAGYYTAKILANGQLVPGDISYLNIAPAPFFTGEASLGGGWYYLSVSNQIFGYYQLDRFPYVYHVDMGWEYFIDATNAQNGAYFYDFTDRAFFYTEPALFPYLYDFNANAWLYYAPLPDSSGRYSSNPRWFYNYSTQAWTNHL